MITDAQIDTLFEEMLNDPKLASWQSDLTGREHEDARALFREAVRQAIHIYLMSGHI